MPPEILTLAQQLDQQSQLIVMIVAGLLGGFAVIMYDIYVGKMFTWRWLSLLLLGPIAALIPGIINQIQGNLGLFLTSLLAGIGAIALLEQHLGQSRHRTKVEQQLEEYYAQKQQLQAYSRAFARMKRAIDNDYEITQLLQTFQESLEEVELAESKS